MRRFLLLLTILCSVFLTDVQAQNPRLTAPKNVCLNGYATMHAFFDNGTTERMVNWRITYPDNTVVNHRYDQQGNYPGGHHPDFRYMSGTNGQSVTFNVNQVGVYTVLITIEYRTGGNTVTSTSRTKTFTSYDCSMDECEGTYTPATNFKETFGTFTAGGPRREVTAPATISYNYNSSGSLADNDYSIYYNSRLGGRPEWDDVGDHTDNGNGGMLIANSSDDPKLFYRRTINGLCPGAKYNFSAWFINLNSLTVLNSTCESEDYRYAGVTFIVRNATTNTIIKQFNTYDVSMDLSRNLPGDQRLTGWQQYGGTVTLAPGEENVVVEIMNNNPGGCGNDIAVDDIEFVFCAPKIYSYIDGLGVDNDMVCPGAEMTLTSVIEPNDYFSNPVYRWEMNKNNTSWVPVTDPGYTGVNTPILHIGTGTLQEEDYIQYRLMVFEAGNISTRACYTPSNMVILSVPKLPSIQASRPRICRGEVTTLTASPLETSGITGYETFNFVGPNIMTWPTLPVPKDKVMVNPTVTSNYQVTGSISYGSYGNGQPRVCTKEATIQIQVDQPPTVNLGPDQTVCVSTPVTLDAGAANAIYPILWTPTSLTTQTITFNSPAIATTQAYKVTVTNGECQVNDTVNITSVAYPVPVITGQNVMCDPATFTLSASAPAAGTTGQWSIIGNAYGTTILNPTSHNTAQLQNMPYDQPIRLRWTVTANGTSCAAFVERDYTKESRPVATSGPNITQCSNVFVLTGNAPPNATMEGTWTNTTTTSTVTFSDIHDPAATATLVTGTLATLRWTMAKITPGAVCGPVPKTLTITYSAPPAITITSTNIAACMSGATPQFSVPYTIANSPTKYDLYAVGPNAMPGFTDVINSNFSTTPMRFNIPAGTLPGTYTFRIVARKTTPIICEDEEFFSVRIETPSTIPTVSASAANICIGESTTLTANGTLGSNAQWVWYRGGCGTGVSVGTGPSISVSPTANTTYYVRAEGGVCASTTCGSATITVSPLPTPANAGTDQEKCNTTIFALSANTPSVGTGTWTLPAGVSLVSGTLNTPTATVSVPVGQTVTLSWTISNGACIGTPDEVVLSNLNPVTNNVISSNQLVCPGNAPATLTGTGTPSGGNGTYTYQWQISTTSASSGFSNIPGATSDSYTPTALTQTTWFRRTVTSGACVLASNVIEIRISNNAPVVTSTPAARTVECQTGTDYTLEFGTPAFSHPDGLALTITHNDVTTPQTCGVTITRTWTAIDPCGRSVSTSQTITVTDTTDPVFTTPVPGNTTVQCDAIPTQPDLTATDNCAAAVNIVKAETRTNGACPNSYTLTRTWTATDACGNQTVATQVITVVDNTAPTFTTATPANVTVQCDAIPTQPDLTATDNCTVNVTVVKTQTRTNGACPNSYTLTRTWTATDECGNVTSVSQIVTVIDDTDPVFTTAVPANATVQCDAVPTQPDLAATDNCTTNVTVVKAQTRTDGSCPNSYTLTRTWTATDECGNQSVATQIITVVDNTDPVFTTTAPANVTVQCDAVPTAATLTATDNCSAAPDVTVTMTEAITAGACANSYTLVRTWTATDECGNTASVAQTITVVDNTAPTFTTTAPANVTVQCDAIPTAATLTATDNCSATPDVTVTMTEAITAGACANSYTLVRTWTATDECGNAASVSQTITVVDNTAPTFTAAAPANVTVQCDAVPAAATLTASDNCSATPDVTVNMVETRTNGACDNSYTLLRTWTATDECGNAASVSQTITVVDNTAPTFTTATPANVTVQCDAVPAAATLTATDNCSASANVTVNMVETRTNGACDNSYTLLRTWTATDECGNAASVSQTITVVDNTAPTFTTATPANVTVQCDAIPTAATLTASDNCSATPDVTVTMTEAITAGACANSYTLVRTWTATDECGNATSVSQTITVVDNTAPTFTTATPANVTVQCDAVPAAATLTASDNCSATPNVTVNMVETRTNGACDNSYTLLRTWTATDECGNATSVSQTITVVDNTAPTFTTATPANVTVQCDAVPTAATLTASDNCSATPNVTVNMVETRTNGACDNSYTLVRTWTATDECGNAASVSQTITVVDNTAPTFTTTAPANVTVQCDAVPAAVTLTASDNCSATPNVTVNMVETRTNGACDNSYTLLRTWTATDECGNATSVSQTITVVDNTAPTFTTATPANVTVQCDAVPTAATLTASDNCSATPNVTVNMVETRTNGACDNSYTLLRTWTATDECGNAASVSQTITVVDNTAPTFTTTAPANVTVQCDAVPAAATLTATDNCSASANVTVNMVETRTNGACDNSYTLLRTWTATDECGNAASVSQTITVVDNTAPTFTTATPANVTVQCDAIPTAATLTASDNCSATPDVTVTMTEAITAGACANSYTLVRTWTATDECGNTASVAQTITVVDNTAPTFTTTAPANVTVQCDAIPTAATLTATDNCSATPDVTVTMSEAITAGACANSYTLVRTWTATDECGNTASVAQTITVVDNTAPIFTTATPASVTVQCDAVPAAATLTASDNCSATPNVTVNMVETRTNGACDNSYTLLRTWTATDECGNATSVSQTITVVDNTAPTFTTATPANVTVQCDAVPTAATLTATDNCSATPNVTVNMVETRTNGACDNSYTLLRTWTATDECGNAASVSQTITVVDNTAPTFTTATPANVTVQCDAIPTAATLTATDNCSATPDVTVNMVETRTNGACDNSYTLLRTWTATDECGNAASVSQTITVVDNTAPTFTTATPANVTVQCDAIPTAATLTAADNCSATPDVTVTMTEAITAGACANSYTLVRTWTATDECGNTASVAQTITVVDNTAPTFTTATPANVTVQCDAIPTAATLTATDNCSASANVTVNMVETRTNGACDNSYTLLRTWTATDECGNTASVAQTITVVDNTAPTFTTTAPANVTVQCDAIPTAATLTATDNCSATPDVTVTMTEAITAGACANSYTLVRTWTATDECGNAASVSQTITVVDNTAPTFTTTAPANVTVQCDAVPAAATLTASDNCSATPNVTVNMVETRTNGACDNSYTLLRTWTATDECGNTASVSQTITVVDNTAPTFTAAAPANVTVQCDAVPAAATLNATDNCSATPDVTVNMVETRTNGACDNSYTLLRTWTATDECGNAASVSQTITVVDNTAPTFTTATPANVTVQCDAIPTAATLTATDNCSASANVTVNMVETRTNGACDNSYTLLRTWTATDECGNAASVSQTITVVDNTAPTFTTATPANVTVQCDAIPTAATLTATDNCSATPDVTVTMTEAITAGACANSYTLVRTWTATDECGNAASVSQTITVVDNTAPTFTTTAPANVTVQCDAVPTAATLTATDNCSATPDVTVTMTEAITAGACANSYTLVRTWTATDECGNATSVSQTITVVDNTAPTFTAAAPANVTVQCDAVPAAATLTASDNCSATPNVTVNMVETRTNGACDNSYTLVRTWTATDECGNAASVSQTITVVDNTAPTFTTATPANVTVQCDAVPTAATLTASDNCSATPNVTVNMVETRTNGACDNSYTLLRTWTATDECGNAASVSQTITVVDNTAPTFTTATPANVTVQCDAVPAAATLTATDNCSASANVTVNLVETRTNGACDNSYTLLRTWTATDECGNAASVSQTITVVDNTAPTFTTATPANVTVQCDAIPTAATLTATDNCSASANVTVNMVETRTNGACDNSYTLLRTWTATDECGNAASVSQTITVVDNTAPTFTTATPANVTVQCDAIPTAAKLTATDNCSASANVTVNMVETRTNGACDNSYTLLRTWTATDECGNAASVSQTITVVDNTAPTFTTATPANVTVQCDAIPTAATLTATDNCSATPDVTVTMTEAITAGACANSYTLVRTWTATDECGNTTSVSQTITVVDNTAPTFTAAAPANVTVQCDAVPAAATLTASDNCSATPNVTVNMVETRTNGACDNSYTLLRTWTATDECGNAASVSQTITVVDNTAPTFTTATPANVTVQCDAVPSAATLTATDNCSATPDVTVNMVETRTNGACDNSYTLVRTWTATDECGNAASVSQTITVVDNTAPTFTTATPANVTVQCDAVPAAATLTASDNCSATPNVTVNMVETRTNGACDNSYTLVRTWTATDECGNAASVSQTITVVDNTAPTFTTATPANVTVQCDAIPTAATLTASDNCSATPNVTVNMVETRTNGACDNSYTLLRTWTATDECGNAASVSQTITVVDNTAPTFTTTAPANVTVQCDAIPTAATLTATDNCSASANVTVNMVETRTNGSCANSYTLVRTWTATDECGNAATVSQTITVVDNTAPTFTTTAPANVTVECDAIPTPATLTATDNCSATPNVTVAMTEVRTNGACANSYTLVRTWTATDECGNIATVSQTITVVDNTAPTFTTTAPANVTVQCDAVPAAATLAATDNCSATPNVTVNMVETRTNGACANSYTLVRTWTATDECGNASSVSQTITVQDNTAPTFTTAAPADATVDCNAIPAQPDLAATDNCSATPAITIVKNEVRQNLPGACANNYLLVRTWTATDACGNSRTVQQVLTVQDTTKPVFTTAAPANITVDCDAVPTQPTLTATDNCSVTANVTVTMAETRTNGACANSYTLTRTWTATDECGNATILTQVITVQDTTKPVFNMAAPADVTVSCDAIPTAPALTASDNCSAPASVTVTMNETRTNGSCANSYTLVRTWTATDECGNQSVIRQTITVEDRTAPVFTTAAPANVTVECDAIPAQAALTATDNCSAPASVTVLMNETKQPIPGRCVNNYLLIRTWTAIDECNNTTTVTQTITVVDNTAPAFTTATPANVTVECNNIPAAPAMSAVDNCSLNNVNVVYNEVRTNGACANSYTLVRTWTATDECGNAASVSQTITVEDRTAPAFTTAAPANVTVQCNAVPAQPDLTATDNCSASANITIVKSETRVNGTCANSYTLTRTWTATDECGNSTTIQQTVTVVDNTKPTFTTATPADVTVECNAIPSVAVMQATDNCSAAANVTVTFNEQRIDITGACANNYKLLRTWTATDECGNATTVLQVITVQDTTAPAFTAAAPADAVVNCDNVPAQPAMSATDNCSVTANVQVVMAERRENIPGACANNYRLVRTWTATDECGNSRTVQQVLTVQDTTKPVFTIPTPANVTVECNAIPAQPNLTAADNCSANVTVTRSERMEQIPGAMCASNYRLIRTWTATDECGNSTTVQQTITVEDHTAPTFTMPTPADVTVECNAIPAQPNLTASDNCTPSNNVTIVKSERRESIPGAICASNYRLIRTWTVTDLCGNATTVTQTLTVQDNTAPAFTMPTPPDATVECNAIPVQPNLTATDNCTPTANIRIVKNEVRQNIPGACANNYRLIRTWTATDECGNTTTVQQILTVADRTAPTFTTTTPADVTVECNAIPVQPDLAAMDNCSVANSVTIVKNERREDIPGACANNYRLIRTWTTTDECGNSRTVQQVITVRDTTKPVFTTTTPANITVECNAIPVQMPLTATDNCSISANVTVTMSETKETIPGACVNNYRLIRSWTATDECGNSTVVKQTVTVQDKTAPVFNAIPPASLTVNCHAVPAAPVLTATDNCSGNNVTVMYSFTKQQLSATCVNNYKLNRTWTVTDECGNKAVITQVVTVIDTTAPVFNTPAPADMTVSCDAIPAPFIVTASDNCSRPGAVTVTHKQTRETIPGACKANYRLINTWTAKDECGNTSVLRQVITVVDTTRPVIAAAPADITLVCGQAIPTADIKLRATDNCDGTFPKMISYTIDPFVKDLCSGYTITRRWSVSDECGNAAQDVTQRIIVLPCPKPVLEADVVVNCSSDPFITLKTGGIVNRPSYTLVAVTPSNAIQVPITSSNPRFNVNGATTASFIVRDGITGCASDTVTYTISYLQMPKVNLGNDTSLCGGNGMVLDAGPANFGYQIKWSTGETTQRIRVTQPGTYKVTVSNGICTATDEIKVGVIPMPLIDLPDTTICRGQNVILNATVDGGTYLWSTGATTPSINVSTQERFWVRVAKNGCITIDTINVSVNPPPDISLSRDTAICPGQSVQLTVNTNAGRVQWGTGELGNSITVSKAGNYSVAVYRDNCVVRETVRVAQRPDMKFDLGPDRIICPGGSVLIDARNPDASTYRWSDGDINPVKSLSQAGKYKIGVLDRYCDRYKEDSINIIVAGPPTVSLGNDTTICRGRRFTLRANTTNATTYLWSNGQTGSSIEVTQAGTYTVTAFNDCGSTTDDITINVTDCDSRPDFPNAFSPNGDGNNDVFRPVVRGPMYDYELRIYNRWGELVFISRDMDKGWNGWYKGRPVDIGTFVWWLTYKKTAAGPAFVIKGDVTVIR